MAGNIAGIDARLSPDLKEADLTTFLSRRKPLPRVAIRHTVGLDDPIEGEGGVADARENSGARYFKLKLSGDPVADAARLARIGKELDALARDYKVTLDANEQYADLAALHALIGRLDHDPALRSISSRLLYVEQPMPRDVTRQSPLGSLATRGFIIDEADDSYDAFPAARALGYRGISSKSCKGLYKSIVNATRAAKWSTAGERFFVTGEDLTCQAGLAVQQDLALGAFIGIAHAERNGHHYVDGFGDTPAAEAAGLRRRTSRSLCGCRAGHPALHPRRRSPDGIASHNGLCDVGPSGLVGASPARTAKITLRSNRHDHPTPRPHHERRHRPHGAQPASDPLDRRDPRAGRRPLEERRPRDARSDPGRPQRRESRGAREAIQRCALDHRPRCGARRQERHHVLRRRDHAGTARPADRRPSMPASMSIARSRSRRISRRRSRSSSSPIPRASSTARCRTSCSCPA